ncbi:MAG: hypothetical protein KGL11_02605 [Alphaproteobacteria bacterium]|nr:hypothetical protein [Alphaproteobacteria bacterium]
MARPSWRSVAALAVAAWTLAACAAPATHEGMTAPVAATAKPNRVLKGAIAVGDVTGGAATDPMAASRVGNGALQQALQDSLAQAGYLAPTPKAARYRLNATLQELDQSGFTLTADATVKSTVLYRLVGRGANAEYPVTATGTATFQDSSIFETRLRIANERSIQANIEQLLKQLHAF